MRKDLGRTSYEMPALPKPTLLIISQVYVPDPAAVGQHMHDAAEELARRGLRVKVLTSQRGYENPSDIYPKRERRDGVAIRRLPFSSFGKRSILRRLLGALSFLGQVLVHAILTPRPDGLLVSTSPPMCSLAAIVISHLRRVPIVYWAMDINPDQAIALGKVRSDSIAARLLEALNRSILQRADRIVTLDAYMAARLKRKVAAQSHKSSSSDGSQDRSSIENKLAVIPPWPSKVPLESVAHERNPFRREHGLNGKFVFMYSGNMSPAHPLDTILQATLRLRNRPDVVFMFIGGGLEKEKVKAFAVGNNLNNIRVLPYQPLDRVRYSLSAADVHLVSMGDNMVGVVHPCKIYGAMSCARPVLLVGPSASHAGEIIERYQAGWQVNHDDADGIEARIREILSMSEAQLCQYGALARQAVENDISKEISCQDFCDEVEGSLAHSFLFTRPVHSAAVLEDTAVHRDEVRTADQTSTARQDVPASHS